MSFLNYGTFSSVPHSLSAWLPHQKQLCTRKTFLGLKKGNVAYHMSVFFFDFLHDCEKKWFCFGGVISTKENTLCHYKTRHANLKNTTPTISLQSSYVGCPSSELIPNTSLSVFFALKKLTQYFSHIGVGFWDFLEEVLQQRVFHECIAWKQGLCCCSLLRKLCWTYDWLCSQDSSCSPLGLHWKSIELSILVTRLSSSEVWLGQRVMVGASTLLGG